jgi:hypothetical protein
VSNTATSSLRRSSPALRSAKRACDRVNNGGDVEPDDDEYRMVGTVTAVAHNNEDLRRSRSRNTGRSRARPEAMGNGTDDYIQ